MCPILEFGNVTFQTEKNLISCLKIGEIKLKLQMDNRSLHGFVRQMGHLFCSESS